MKIVYFKLDNFSLVLSAMKRRTITIDLSKSKNRVILFVGENGTGKTAILSQMHPFATSGTMDVRSGMDLIIHDENDNYEDGYKEIHYLHNGNKYIIKHYYLYKSNKGMKSYISKNGEELNPNGNVSSFKELVELELHITQEYLKLLRLGPNVTNFIRMKASERKNFTSELLGDIDIYSKLYKKINEDNRLIRSLLRSVIDKIEKLRVRDETEEYEELERLEKQLELLKRLHGEIQTKIGTIDGSINTLAPDGLDLFISDIKIKSSEYKELLGDIKSIRGKIEKTGIIVIHEVDDAIKEIDKELSEAQNKITVNKNMIEFYFNRLNSLYDQKKEKGDGLKYIASEVEYSRLTDLYLSLNKEKDDLDKKFKGSTPKCTRDEILTALSVLQEIEKFANDIYEFDTGAVDEVLKYVIKGKDVESIARREVVKIDDKVSRLNTTLSFQANKPINNPNKVYILFKPTDCTCACPFQQFYEDVSGHKSEEKKDDVRGEIERLESKREYYLQFNAISKKIDYILLLIKSNTKLAEKMPENFFDVGHILSSIKDYVPFYDEDYITNYVALIEEYDRYLELDIKIKEVLREKTFIEKNGNSIISIQNELASLDKEIAELEKEQKQLKKENEQLTERVEQLETLKERYQTYKDYKAELDEKSTDVGILEKSLHDMELTKEKIQSLLEQKKQEVGKLHQSEKDIHTLETTMTNTRFRLMEFKNFSTEKKQLEEEFEDIALIKDALSSNKGIPLLFIKLYLQNTVIKVNQLLNRVYDGDLEIDTFIINEKEFRIPYFKNGMRVSDVVACSQGEESFVSIALSFALISQSLSQAENSLALVDEIYNIMLLDEVDATLDTKKREQFISIIEEQLDSINAEQVFIITHNNMFDNYPVDIIRTSNVPIDNYKNTNIIFSA